VLLPTGEMELASTSTMTAWSKEHLDGLTGATAAQAAE
jgi:hypothetical protein